MRAPDSRDAGWSLLSPLMEAPRGHVIELPKLPRLPQRPPSIDAEALRCAIVADFWTLDINWPELTTKEIVYRVCAAHGVGRSYVFRVLRGVSRTKTSVDSFLLAAGKPQ
jgi:hypothetical protein